MTSASAPNPTALFAAALATWGHSVPVVSCQWSGRCRRPSCRCRGRRRCGGPSPLESAFLSKSIGVQNQGPHPLVEVREAFVPGLALLPAGVDLLQDHGELEVTEDHVPVHLGEVPPALLSVTLHELRAGHEAGRGGHRRHYLFELLGVCRLGPVGERDGQVEEWIAHRGHLPVEDGTHLGQVVGVEHQVVELVIVVNDGRLGALGDVSDEPVGERLYFPDLVGFGLLVAPDPAPDLPLEKAIRAAQVPEPCLLRVHGVQLRQGVRYGARDPMAELGGRHDSLRELIVHHDAFSPLHYVKGRPDDRLVLAEEVRPRREWVRLVQFHKHAGLATHVVGFGGNAPERRTPQHALPLPYLEQVREVGSPGGKLAHLEFAFGEIVYVLPEVALGGPEVETLPLAHAYRLQGISLRPAASQHLSLSTFSRLRLARPVPCGTALCAHGVLVYRLKPLLKC